MAAMTSITPTIIAAMTPPLRELLGLPVVVVVTRVVVVVINGLLVVVTL